MNDPVGPTLSTIPLHHNGCGIRGAQFGALDGAKYKQSP